MNWVGSLKVCRGGKGMEGGGDKEGDERWTVVNLPRKI